MHSPPPTPQTRSSTRRSIALAAAAAHAPKPAGSEHEANDRKRTRDQAGMITPRPTPAKVIKRGIANIDDTAKILFPGKRQKQFQVFQDHTPSTVLEDPANPFTVPGAPKHPQLDTEEGQSNNESGRRTDGIEYVFRGRKVFKKYEDEAAKQEAEAIKPRRLFTKEMSAPKLSNPFDDDGFDGLELSTYQPGRRRVESPIV